MQWTIIKNELYKNLHVLREIRSHLARTVFWILFLHSARNFVHIPRNVASRLILYRAAILVDLHFLLLRLSTMRSRTVFQKRSLRPSPALSL